jgi:AcrR family transcriptional regulator
MTAGLRGFGGTPRLRLVDDERERLLRAAVELVAEEGYRRVGERAIWQRAGVEESAFGRCFDGRERCVLAAFQSCVARARLAVSSAADFPSWEHSVAAGVQRLLELCERDMAMARFLVVESLCCTPAVLYAREQAVAELSRFVDRGRPGAPPGLVAGSATAGALVRSAIELVHARILSETPSLAVWHRALTGMILLCYRPTWGDPNGPDGGLPTPA